MAGYDLFDNINLEIKHILWLRIGSLNSNMSISRKEMEIGRSVSLFSKTTNTSKSGLTVGPVDMMRLCI